MRGIGGAELAACCWKSCVLCAAMTVIGIAKTIMRVRSCALLIFLRAKIIFRNFFVKSVTVFIISKLRVACQADLPVRMEKFWAVRKLYRAFAKDEGFFQTFVYMKSYISRRESS